MTSIEATRPAHSRIGPLRVTWGERTLVMGICNVTPDSFSGDGLLEPSGETSRGGPAPDPVDRALAQARRMAEEGADLIDVGGESTRPGHASVDVATEIGRVVPVISAIARELPDLPISVDTSKAEVAEAALDAGAHLLNDVWATSPAGGAMARLAADRAVPLLLMHNRTEARYDGRVIDAVRDELAWAVDRALALGVTEDMIMVDPGIGFGKTADHNVEVLRDLGELRALGRPILLGTSRKSTIGRILGLPPEQRVEGTLATTALGIAAGVDIVRVHDVAANVRAVRVADAIVRGTWHAEPEEAP